MDKKRKHAKLDRILWVDLEMTGLSPTDDLILEVAGIVTDWNFTEIATYEGVVHVPQPLLDEKLAGNAIFWDANPEARQGLLDQNQAGKSSQEIEQELIAFVGEHFDLEKPVLLAGNSIHMDRRFIEQQWKQFDKLLHYRMLDVSAWKVVFDGKFGKKFAKPEEHRALGDIRGSIMELQYYLGKVSL